MCFEDVVLLFRQTWLDVASNLMLRYRGHIWVPGLIGHARLWHVLVMLLVVLLVKLFGGSIVEVVCIHCLVRRKGTAVIHLAGQVLELHSVCPALVRADRSECGRADVARRTGR
jgi:hypothetical protein